ncbi:MAG: hypothetical protein HY329_14020 [Chloroflexi bacterium]|nr:hypothetical protein [Chloroflexota bacterium]
MRIYLVQVLFILLLLTVTVRELHTAESSRSLVQTGELATPVSPTLFGIYGGYQSDEATRQARASGAQMIRVYVE